MWQPEKMDEVHDNFQCPYLANAVGVLSFTAQLRVNVTIDECNL